MRRIPCRCAQTPLHGGMRESAGLWKRWPAAICAPPTWWRRQLCGWSGCPINLFIVLNTLMRKAVEAAQVHPFYIDAISAKWAMRIETVEQEADLYPMRREIVEDYCRLAQTRSMASYSPNVRSMLTYVQFNLAEGISLEAIARQLGVNASYLSSQFNREVGKSLPEYVSEKRIAEAKRLLRGRAQLPIGQIAAAVGFSDVNYFTKVFKKKAGQTPSAYRAAQRALAAEQKEI